jgi:hypothetical protein
MRQDFDELCTVSLCSTPTIPERAWVLLFGADCGLKLIGGSSDIFSHVFAGELIIFSFRKAGQKMQIIIIPPASACCSHPITITSVIIINSFV